MNRLSCTHSIKIPHYYEKDDTMNYKASDDRYHDKMPYRRCGKSGLKLPLISLGLWQNFGGVNSFENSRDMVLTAFDNGITHFDLANNYGPPPGSAEETFGKILKNVLMPYRDELVISTKAGYLMWGGPYGEWGSRKYILSSLDQSLKRMGIPYVDIFYSHRFDPDTPLEETMGALATAVQSGKALYAGISSYSPENTKKAAELLKQMGVPCLIHQPSYSMFNRWIEDGLQDVLDKEGMGSIAFCPLHQGYLTNRYFNGLPADSRMKRNGTFDEGLVEKAKQLDVLARERGQTLAQMALAWILRGDRVTSALIGTSSTAQLMENLGAVQNLDFTAEELKAIDSITK